MHRHARWPPALDGVLADTTVAAGIALNLITAAFREGAQATYTAHQVEFGHWVTEADAKVCPICLVNEAAGSVPIGDPYPSGDTAPPAHVNCRCAVVRA